MSDQRFFYVQRKDNPMGWGVEDHKHGRIIMYGDKLLCAVIAGLLNGNPYQDELKNFAACVDGWAANSEVSVA